MSVLPSTRRIAACFADLLPEQPTNSWAVERAAQSFRNLVENQNPESMPLSHGTAYVIPMESVPAELLSVSGLSDEVVDHRYNEVVHRTLPDFPMQCLVLCETSGKPAAVQPFFVVQQNLLAGMNGGLSRLAGRIRKYFPRFLTLRTLMVGSPAGAGALGLIGSEALAVNPYWLTRALGEAFEQIGKARKARIIVFKDFPAAARPMLAPLTGMTAGYFRLPSMPMTGLSLKPYRSFEQYMQQAVSKVTRKGLRRKFRDAEAANLELTVTHDISGCVDEVYALYLQVYARASLTFEKLSPEFLLELSRRMPDRVRFFLWRLKGPGGGKLVAASVTLMNASDPGVERALFDLYLGLDYSVALDLHLYFLTMRDVIDWAIANGIETYYSTPLNYDAKLHLRHRLVPLDLYVRHLNPYLNPLFKLALRFAEPTRHDKILPQFPNAHELKG